MENRYSINYDIKQRVITNARFKQGDIDSSILELHLLDNALAVNITGETIEFRFIKPDSTVVYQDSISGVTITDASNGIVQCILKSTTLAAAGIMKCEIHRSKDGKELTTPAFNFTVESSIGETGILSTNYIGLIEDKIIDWQTEFNLMKAAYEAATNENTVVELTDARHDNINNVDYDNIGERMDNVSSELAERALQTDLVVTNTIATDAQTKSNNPVPQIPTNSIPSLLLKNTTDGDKVGLANLKTEVISAMNGTSPTGTTPTDGSVTTVKVANEAITKDKLSVQGRFGLIYGSAPIDVRFSNLQIVIPANTGIFFEGVDVGYSGTIRTIAIPNTNALALVYNRSTNVFEFKTAISVNKDHILIMVIWGAFSYVSSPNSYIINSIKTNTKNNKGIYVGLTSINYDKINSQLIIPANARVIYNGIEYGVRSSPVTLSVINGSICTLVVSMTTGTWAIRVNITNITTDDIIVGILWNGTFVTEVKYYINGDYQSNGFGMVSGTAPINFDTVLHTVTIPIHSRVYKDNGYYSGSTLTDNVVLQLNGTASWIIVFNKVTNEYSAKSMPTHTISESNDEIPFATYWAGKCFAFGVYTINGSLSGSFVEASHRLLVSPKMYFAKGTKLPIYKSGITNISSQTILNNIKTSVNYTLADGTPQFKYFDNDIDLDGEVLPSTFDVVMKSDVMNGFYSVPVTKQYVDPATKSASTPKVLMNGDSLTNRYLPKYTKDKLVSMGITPTMVGTMANTGGENGEGRESWCFAHFIGRDTTLGMVAGENHILPQPTGTSSDLNSNPFVRLATADDYSAHPNWCFRNSANGSFNELSYAEDIDKTGNFYIFDFANYVVNHLGGVYPDIVTIALGTNDLTKAPSLYNITGLQSCRLGLDIMLHQIKTANPTTKIAVIPSPAWGVGDWWETKVTEWIENAMKDVVTFALADVNIVPVWAHMDRSFVFPSTQTALNTLSNEVKNTVTEALHFGTLGQKQYANVIASYVVNQL